MLNRLRRQDGFTLIELLVVIVILVALAAIALPVLLNQQDKSEAAARKTSMVAIASVISVGFAQGNIVGIDSQTKAIGDSIAAGSEPLANDDARIATKGITGWIDMVSHTYCLDDRYGAIYTQDGWATGTCPAAPA